jgi:ATP-binding cassette subfamily F protein 3
VLVQLADVHFGYPGTEIFEGLTFQVNPGDRIGLVGPNGCGKSTLLRLLDGRLTPDRGTVARARGLSIAYLQQSQEFQGHHTVLDALLRPFARILQIHEELSEIERALEQASGDEAERLLARYGTLQDEYTRQGGYTLESRVKQLADDLGFPSRDLGRSVDTLSGGERGRLELTKTLLAEPDLLLLDEPTNHLDMDAVEHLEARLKEWSKAFVLVSHDRWFLRAVCRDIVEVENGQAIVFTGGYDRYVVEREERHERLNAAYERQRAEIARTEDFIRRNIAGQKTKQAKSRRKMLEKVERLARVEDEFEKAGQIGLQFSVGDHAGGKEAVKASRLTAGYPGKPLVRDLDLVIYRGDRVGFVGPNGCGKSTLLKTLLGKIPALAGEAALGHEVRVGYFDQKLSDLDEEKSLIEEVRSIRGDFNEDRARAFLGRFRFSGDDPFRKVKGLSGGERNRLALAKMMLEPRNLLALDEPTNHLDIPAVEVLEEALEEYEGTLLIVSHDRWFLDRVVDKILYLHDGRAELHAGNYSDWRARREEAERAAKAEKATKPVEPARRRGAEPAPPPAQSSDDKSARIAEREKKKAADRELERKRKRFAELETKIAEAERAMAALDEKLASDHGGDWQKLHGLVAEKEKLAHQLRSYEGEWEKLGLELESAGPSSS